MNYEQHFDSFLKYRGRDLNGVGSAEVGNWCKHFSNKKVLDIGCGTGIPISILFNQNKNEMYGIDHSPKMIHAFQRNLPQASYECGNILTSEFFNMKFDIIIAWGVLFCFNSREQDLILSKISSHLNTDGEFLFTAPIQKAKWTDIMTGQQLESLGREQYINLFKTKGLELQREFQDSGENDYFLLKKIVGKHKEL